MYVYYNIIILLLLCDRILIEPQNDTSGPRQFVTLPQEVTLVFLIVSFIIYCKNNVLKMNSIYMQRESPITVVLLRQSKQIKYVDFYMNTIS